MKTKYYRDALIFMAKTKLTDDACKKLAAEMYAELFGGSLDVRLDQLLDDYQEYDSVHTEIGTLNIRTDMVNHYLDAKAC